MNTNEAKIRLALDLLDQALRTPLTKSQRRPIRQERYFRVALTRYDSDCLKLQPWYGDPRYANIRIVMEYDIYGKSGGKVLDFEIINGAW